MNILNLLVLVSAVLISEISISADSISIMTYNVENLFDLKHDPRKNDYTFLPIAEKRRLQDESHCEKIAVPSWKTLCLELDWSRQALDTKLARLANVITGNQPGHGPDILVLQEVENIEVLSELALKFLSKEGYASPILIEGLDHRGIDCGILSRFPLDGPPTLSSIPLMSFSHAHAENIRGVLAATFKLPKSSKLTVLAVHFPSPQKKWILRRQTLDYLNTLAHKFNKKNQTVVAAGDFNNSFDEEQKFGLFRKFANPHWHVSHLEGCQSCLGTHFHQKTNTWSFLDAIMLYRSDRATWKIADDSIHVVSTSPVQSDKLGRPVRFSSLESAGVSDHLPMALNLVRVN